MHSLNGSLRISNYDFKLWFSNLLLTQQATRTHLSRQLKASTHQVALPTMASTTRDAYVNPLCARYASKEMSYQWSPARKFGLWRRIWLALAESQQELGLKITDEQLPVCCSE